MCAFLLETTKVTFYSSPNSLQEYYYTTSTLFFIQLLEFAFTGAPPPLPPPPPPAAAAAAAHSKLIADIHRSKLIMATLPRRNSVSSFNTGNERELKENKQTSYTSSRPPLMNPATNSKSSGNSSNSKNIINNKKQTNDNNKLRMTSNLASDSRPPTKPPPLPSRSVAVSQEETCFVSAAGDVLVCRSREFSQLLETNSPGDDSASINPSSSYDLRWCDIECSELPISLEKSSLCNPWLTSQREEKKEDDRSHMSSGGGGGGNRPFAVSAKTAPDGLRGGGGGGTSTYEWGNRRTTTHESAASTGQRKLHPADVSTTSVAQTTQALNQLELEISDSASNNNSNNMTSPREQPLSDGLDSETEMDDNDNVLSMPSFDYSHFKNGGNDMLPTSPVSNRSRRSPSDTSAEIDTNISLKLPLQTAGSRGRQQGRLTSSERQSYNNNHNHNNQQTPKVTDVPLYHGVPTFLKPMAQIRIQQVSAHPRGSHVLMISAEALLFSYGLNDHGQLGIGIKSPRPTKGTGPHQRYVWTPTIITPLLENGGKAITCAAGESHSLVVVSTEGRRVLKSRSPRSAGTSSGQYPQSPVIGTPAMVEMNRVSSSPATMDTRTDNESEHSSTTSSPAESVWHHQLYGFGRNNFMKIGLIHPRPKTSSPDRSVSSRSSRRNINHSVHGNSEDSHQDEMEDVLLPHRVALHCTVWPEKAASHDDGSAATLSSLNASKLPPQGIFALSASSEHSAALVRRATGNVELYMWGNAAYHALGIEGKKRTSISSHKIVPVPTIIEKLSYTNNANVSYTPAAAPILMQNPAEFPLDVSLGPYSSFVVTSAGRLFSFGISYDGMLGHGKSRTDVPEPTPIHFPSRNASGSSDRIAITAVSAGTGHVMALSKCGTVFTWGKNTDGRLGLGESPTMPVEDEVSDLERAIEYTPQALPPLSTLLATSSRLPAASPVPRDPTKRTPPTKNEYGPIVQVCAGLDCSIIVTACGKVLSCGKSSGRLGLGETNQDVNIPTPLFGGLSLWHRPAPARMPRRNSASISPSPARNRPALKRGLTTG